MLESHWLLSGASRGVYGSGWSWDWMDDPEDLDDSVCQDAQKVLKLTGNRDQEALDWLRQSVGDIKSW